jgi:uncharacterized protein YndB with AHSA1/START domain
MLRTELSVDIKRPLEEVWAYVVDPSKVTEWDTAALEVRASETPLRVGSKITMVGKFLGKRFETTMEVTELEEHKTFSFKATKPMPFVGTYTFERIGNGTRFREVAEGETHGFFKVADPVFERIVKRQTKADLENLKELLEAQVPAAR